MILTLLFLLCGWDMTVLAAPSLSEPISPAKFQTMLAQGFSTKYFNVITDPPMKLYRAENIQHVKDAGFSNLRLRCSSNPFPYGDSFNIFLSNLTTVVDKCLEVGVMPIVSWADMYSRTYATEENRTNYLSWWEQVARLFKDRDYRLSFNLFTELSNSDCDNPKDCPESLATNIDKYNLWTEQVIKTIRDVGGYNSKRILIMSPPGYTARNLAKINSSIYEKYDYLMAEYHLYASGPNKALSAKGTPLKKYWEGCGSDDQRKTLINELELANEIPLKTYFGAWMATDNKDGALNQTEVECFAKFFVSTLKEYGTPWSMNDLHFFYDTEKSSWKTGIKPKAGQPIDVGALLKVVKENM